MSITPIPQGKGKFTLEVNATELKDITLAMRRLAAERASKRAKRFRDVADKTGLAPKRRAFTEVSVILLPQGSPPAPEEEEDS